MNNKCFWGFLVALLFIATTSLRAEIFIVSSQQEFDDAHDDAAMNDSIIWKSGTFSTIYMEISKNNLFIGATTLGETIFNGASKVKITGDYITLEGLQFVGGDIGTDDIINSYGSYNHFNQLNLKDYTCYKYLRIREECQYNRVTYCNFENRLNLDDQNILSILVDDQNPGYHKIQYCSFKNFDGTGNDLGIEPIRIGLSTQADRISRSLVEYCYFTQCNGDGELISSKATQNVYRFNTFEDNPLAELVLRHGSQAIVYGNFFLNGKGGIRVREGQNHYIYNNYFQDLDDRTIYLQNEDSDPLDNINIAFNTLVDCAEVRLGGNGNDEPTNVTFYNNIFSDPLDDLFEDPTGTETWVANISNGSLGMTPPANGMMIQDPLLAENNEGYFGLESNSPAIDAAAAGYAQLPQFDGMDPIDTQVLFDLMGQDRPALITDKDLGCNEFPHNTTIKPIATIDNTGPDYDTDGTSNLDENSFYINNLVQIAPNPTTDLITLTINNEETQDIKIDIIDGNGRIVGTILDEKMTAGTNVVSKEIGAYSNGIYTLRASSTQNGIKRFQILKFVKQ